MTWSDKQLSAHKKFQAGISMTGATLGLSALGAKGLATAAPKVARLARVAPKADRAATNLTIGGAGVGGVGGFNFAGIQNAESKRKVSKMLDFGLGGVHQGEEISKKLSIREQRNQANKEIVGGAGAGALGGTVANSGGKELARGALMHHHGTSWGKVPGAEVMGDAYRAMSKTHLKGGGIVAGAGLAAAAGGAGFVAHGVKRRQGLKPVSKAFDPERSRHRRLDTYNAGTNAAAGALGTGAVAQGIKAGKGLKKISGQKSVGVAALKAVGRSGGAAAGLGLGALGAAYGAHRIKQYSRTSGRTYRPLY